MATDEQFTGWVAHDKDAAEGKMVWGQFEPKPWEETDVDIAVTHCGICGTDIHTLRNGWGGTRYPVVVGHEIVGKAVRVGSKVTHIKVGDRVGVGAQSDSCRCRTPPEADADYSSCDACASGNEVYCPHITFSYGSPYHSAKGGISQGGYALTNRTPGHFVFKIPDALPSASAAPMLCAGVTVYSPLAHFGRGPKGEELKGMSVGVLGVGGLGHLAVQFARVLGADRVVGISRREAKRADAEALGATGYIATADDPDWAAKNATSLDLIISTVSSVEMPVTELLGLLRRDGVFCQLGLPDDGVFKVGGAALSYYRRQLTGSLMGSPHEIRDMLEIAAAKGVRTWVEERPMSEANQAILDMNAGKARYRYVLVNDA